MTVIKSILYIYAETPMHSGTGTGLGAVDLPIQREKHTDYPIIQASGVKGALRNTAELKQDEYGQRLLDDTAVRMFFGGATGDAGEDFAGAMSPSDARILLFPVRALNGVFVWITSPTVLARYKRDTGTTTAPDMPGDDVQVSSSALLINGQIMLEEYAYPAQHTQEAADWANHLASSVFGGDEDWYWSERLRTHLVILPDDDFRDFVRYSTDIVTRIHIDDVKKTVKKGQLFTQELLPADSLLYSFVHITDSRDSIPPTIEAQDILNHLSNILGERLQIGADETVGRGRVRLTWQEVL